MRTVSSLWYRTRDARLSFEAGALSYAREKKKAGVVQPFSPPSISEMLSEDKLKEKFLLPSYLKGFDA